MSINDNQPPGPTGRYPLGGSRLGEQDDGELRYHVGLDPALGIVRINFGTPVSWIGLDRDHVLALAEALFKAAGARKVEVTWW